MVKNSVRRILRLICSFSVLFLIVFLTSCGKDGDGDGDGDDDIIPIPSNLLDLSGLSWIADDLFIGVHDSKNDIEKKDWPRVSLIRLPETAFEGVVWEVVELEFPGSGGTTSDLESCCRLPGGNEFIMAESGQEGADFRRIFYLTFYDNSLSIISYMNWPVEVSNVEATEVFKVGDNLVFLYAERAEGELSTKLRWAILTLNPFEIGEFKEVTYMAIDPVGPGARPIVAMDIDSEGYIYTVSAYDCGDDDGPYRSVVWKIGQVVTDTVGDPLVVLNINDRLANLDGLKVESIAVREVPNMAKEIYFGTDDEHYGGVLRLLTDSI